MKTAYRNDYEHGSTAWMLAEVGEELGGQVESGNAEADAMDRLTVALYRIGAALTSRLEFLAFKVGESNDDG